MSNERKITTSFEGRNSVNPIIFTDKAEEVIRFIAEVFGGKEDEGARTYDHDGTIFHSEIHVDDTVFIIADRKETWPFTPAFTQIYVVDAQTAVERAVNLGAKIITEPTEYVGVVFCRVQDPHGNIWWIWENLENYDWEAAFGDMNDDEPWKPTKEALYVHDSLVDAMNSMERD